MIWVKAMINKEADKAAEEIKEGKIKTITEEESFNFDCQNCGTCCTNSTDIYMYPNDIYNLRFIAPEKRMLTTYELHDAKIYKIEVDERTGMPLAKINFVQNYKGDPKIHLCGFLTKVKNLGRNDKCFCNSGKKYKKCCLSKKSPSKFYCSIWEHRPVTCRIFPVGRLNVWNEENGYYETDYYISENCIGSEEDKKNSLKDWLGKADLEKRMKRSDDFMSVINKLHKEKVYEYNNYEKYISDIANILFNFDGYFSFKEIKDLSFEDLWKKIEQEIDKLIIKIKSEGKQNGADQKEESEGTEENKK